MCVDVNAEASGLEIEIKLKVGCLSEFIRTVDSLFFSCITTRTHEYNVVLDTLARDLTQRRILLRLRRFGKRSLLTLKTPVQLQAGHEGYKVRQETELTVDDFDKTIAIMQVLGFHREFCYEKFRSEYRSRDGLLLTLDETPIGNFAELEGKPDLIDRYIDFLGYRKNDAICLSYRALFLESGRTGDMLFE